MGIFDSIKRLGKATIGTAMLPVDVVRDTFDFDDMSMSYNRTSERARRVAKNLRKAVDDIDK